MSNSKILQGLKEAVAWTEGAGVMRVHMPGQPARYMTFPEFVLEQTPTVSMQGKTVRLDFTSEAAAYALFRAATEIE
jgi:hypothetical protein